MNHNRGPESRLFLAAAWVCVIFMLYSLATILIVALIGGPPQSAEECFEMIVQNRFTGLLRLDILTVFVMPLYYVLFFALYVLLKHRNPHLISLLTAAVFAGVTIFLSAPSVFSFTHLADQYTSAVTPEAKN